MKLNNREFSRLEKGYVLNPVAKKLFLRLAQAASLFAGMASMTAGQNADPQRGILLIAIAPLGFVGFALCGILTRSNRPRPLWRSLALPFLIPAVIFTALAMFEHGFPTKLGAILGACFIFFSGGGLGLMLYYVWTAGSRFFKTKDDEPPYLKP